MKRTNDVMTNSTGKDACAGNGNGKGTLYVEKDALGERKMSDDGTDAPSQKVEVWRFRWL